MFKFISFTIISLIIASCASNSQRQPNSDLQGGDRLIVKPDWERIERGVSTGDFSCHGTCAELSIDWKKVWRTVSGQEYRDRKQANLSFCISQYQSLKSSLDHIQARFDSGDITDAQKSILNQMSQNSVTGTDAICANDLGKNQAANLKKEILGL